LLRLLRDRRRRRLRGTPVPDEWRRLLEHRFVSFRRLSESDRSELLGHVQVILAEKRFEGCGGLELTDEVRVLIAAQAALLLLHRETDYYAGLFSILVYPDAYLVPVQHETDGGLVIQETLDHVGESWDTGSVILSWKDVVRGATERDHGCNVVLHEFAHQIDSEDGEADGSPRIDDPVLKERWKTVFEREYEKLCRLADKGRRTFIDEYGATHPSEFFAVATEHFFMEPVEFARRHPELYRVLAEFYRQDPNGWSGTATLRT
jgi:MtfA peptidase